MQRPIIDTNILVDLFDNSPKEEDLINYFKKGTYINNSILTNKFIKTLERIITKLDIFEFLNITDEDKKEALKIMKKFSDNQFAFTDSLVLAQSKRLKLKVLTRDKVMQNYKLSKVIIPY